jgi:hypothetical protein
MVTGEMTARGISVVLLSLPLRLRSSAWAPAGAVQPCRRRMGFSPEPLRCLAVDVGVGGAHGFLIELAHVGGRAST